MPCSKYASKSRVQGSKRCGHHTPLCVSKDVHGGHLLKIWNLLMSAILPVNTQIINQVKSISWMVAFHELERLPHPYFVSLFIGVP